MNRREQPPEAMRHGASRRPDTEAQYAKRFRQLEAKANSVLPAPLTIEAFTDWIINEKRPSYLPNSWRLIRASVRYGLKHHYDEEPARLAAALARLDDTRADPAENHEPKTSATKAKRFRPNELGRICNRALSTGAPSALDLALCLRSSNICGLRPCEWPTAEFRPSKEPGYAWEMIVRNAKKDEIRGHGPTRTLRWTALNDAAVATIKAWIARAQEAARNGRYETLVDTMETRMRVITKKMYPRRTSRPTLYTPRHECSARWKSYYCPPGMPEGQRTEGLAIVAALLGHASDATASRHYGRPRRRESFSHTVPHANPQEIAKVRKILDASFDRFAGRTTSMRHAPKP